MATRTVKLATVPTTAGQAAAARQCGGLRALRYAVVRRNLVACTSHVEHAAAAARRDASVIGERWGVTDQEVARHYPCDDFVPSPVLQLWRGVSVDAAPAQVWPWLCQIQLAPYSYDWVDNLGRRSPRELRGLPDPQPGEPFSRMGGKLAVGRVLSIAREDHLTATIMGAVMSYVLNPEGSSTRLLMKIVMERRRWLAPAAAVADWPMARRQLLNLKALAER